MNSPRLIIGETVVPTVVCSTVPVVAPMITLCVYPVTVIFGIYDNVRE